MAKLAVRRTFLTFRILESEQAVDSPRGFTKEK